MSSLVGDALLGGCVRLLLIMGSIGTLGLIANSFNGPLSGQVG